MFSFKSIVLIAVVFTIGAECSGVAVPAVAAAPLVAPAAVGYAHAVPQNIPPYAAQINVVNRALNPLVTAPVAAPIAAAPLAAPLAAAPLAAPYAAAPLAAPYAAAPLGVPFAGPFAAPFAGPLAAPFTAAPFAPNPYAAPYIAGPGPIVPAPYAAPYAAPFPYNAAPIVRASPFGVPAFVR